MTYDQIIARLYELSTPEKVAYKQQKFGVISKNALGIYHKELKELAKAIPKDNDLAIQLFDSGIYEARLLCSKIFRPKDVTEALMEKWVVTFDNWEICDSFCMGLFAKGPLAIAKIIEWSDRENEFERRAAFATLAAYCMADKKALNGTFEQFFPLIEKAASDERLYVRKAVNWALRNIGKRNVDLNRSAIQCAHRLLTLESKSATWVAKDALRELEKEGIRMSDYPRSIYRKKLDNKM